MKEQLYEEYALLLISCGICDKELAQKFKSNPKVGCENKWGIFRWIFQKEEYNLDYPGGRVQ